MPEPTVACVVLTRDRPEYARRAVECFRSQTYENKALSVFDSGDPRWFHDARWPSEVQFGAVKEAGKTIGALRNLANAQMHSDIICHWDSDDWSHPNRIAEQVALLQSSGADCVGYREMLFWKYVCDVEPDDLDMHDVEACVVLNGEAWLYSVPSTSWVLGTSFCYWRRVWEQHEFPDLPRLVDGKPVSDSSSEDVIWRRGVKCVGVSSLVAEEPTGEDRIAWQVPRMIARIHGGNTTNYADLLGPRAGNTWKRAPEWDGHCREVMK